MTTYDVAIVGGGPSGSTAAFHLAKAGRSVVVLDKARFPREKPCGGGVTARCFVEAPVDITPVVEQVVNKVRFSFRLGEFLDYTYPKTLVYMTQRRRLDAFLLDNAASAGAVVMQESPLRGLEMTKTGVTLTTGNDKIEARAVIGADGANGIVAKSVGLTPVQDPPVALEANFLYGPAGEPSEWRDLLAIELGSMDGGYGWSFPKADHFNVGCGGWRNEGGRLREHLASLRHHYGLDSEEMVNVRGHHLPTRTDGTAITRGRVLLVGDAAGLVDPMSGEGIYPAFISGRIAAESVIKGLDRDDPDFFPYEAAIERTLMAEIRAASVLRDAYHYTPRPCYEVLKRSEGIRRALCQLITGEKTYAGFVHQFGPLRPILNYWAARGRKARAAVAA